jgi:hypothetical protein
LTASECAEEQIRKEREIVITSASGNVFYSEDELSRCGEGVDVVDIGK